MSHPQQQEPVVATAYKVVATTEEEEDDTVATAIPTKMMSQQQRLRTVSPFYQHIPEARNLTWSDDFFDEDHEDIVAVFDLDYDSMETFYTNVGWATLACAIVFPQMMTLSLLGLVPCVLRQNIQWTVQAQHVAITRDGIRFVRDKRKTCWGLSCTDAGKSSKTVPFDKITDCDIEEPAGNSCLCVKNILTTVNVDTASSGQGLRELKIAGLKDPHGFKKLVWAMKRAQGSSNSSNGGGMSESRQLNNSSIPQALEMLDRKGTDTTNQDVSILLREIRDELRQHNTLLKSIQPVVVAAATTTETEPEIV